jgi:hypothetical protein
MGWKSQLGALHSEAPFGQQTLDCFHVGQGLSELGYVETQRLKQADFAKTVELLFRRTGERLFLGLYGLFRSRQGFTPGRLVEAYLARGWTLPLTIGMPMILLGVGILSGLLAGRSVGLAVLVVSLVSWLLAVLFLSERFVRELPGSAPGSPHGPHAAGSAAGEKLSSM